MFDKHWNSNEARKVYSLPKYCNENCQTFKNNNTEMPFSSLKNMRLLLLQKLK